MGKFTLAILNSITDATQKSGGYVELSLSVLDAFKHFLPPIYLNFPSFYINLILLQTGGSDFPVALILFSLALTDAGITTIGVVTCCNVTRLFDDFLPFKLSRSIPTSNICFLVQICRILGSSCIKTWSLQSLSFGIRLAVKICHKLSQLVHAYAFL